MTVGVSKLWLTNKHYISWVGPLGHIIRTLQAGEHQFSLKALVARTAFPCTASFPTQPTHGKENFQLFHFVQPLKMVHFFQSKPNAQPS